ncbi:RNA polymerase sigma factor [Fimbriiglobus ruber]|uniref:RNA polymerase sigma factor n=1 Tax=Fimbriiglobus ruber TaxID=1908690 RepID=UPI001EE69B74|nr:sigma-70 family RNA polymerase sigma factor [Fimbriiglobus ruber]
MTDRTLDTPFGAGYGGTLWPNGHSDSGLPRNSHPPSRVALDQDAILPGEENEWIAAAQAGDRQAFARLVDRYWDRLYRWLYHLTRDRHKAEDLAQETFLKVLAALGSFRPGSNFRAWLFRIGHNNFVNLKRTEKRTGHPLSEDTPGPSVGAPEDAAADREALQVVAKAVAELPPEFRAALMLRADEGLSFKEVAAILNITEETARWRVFKARQKLVKVLAPELLPPGVGEGERGT